ncbi:lipopolysaccharide biosynthesis protein [Altererythrobacter lutimaris]|uniref:Lipopolysaccharide biosynthesis protein n=1 Tax=Altererythrobacter lutimaris TaxID=2743979 RepID=A0A850H7X0_9SPHN|nr:lipopolysaccharide biosynthesis protein [Altererythrobacter lutimaris]NVE93335.1 lipopolysaccharide biosynthesis protein [Altererythrobacter lutimaris]
MSGETPMEEPGRRDKLVAGAAWMGGARIVNAAISFTSIILLARLLAPDDFGLFAIATAVSLLITMVSELSVSQALIHVEDLEDGHFDSAFTINIIRAALMSSTTALLAIPVAQFYDDMRLVEVLYIFAGIAFIGALISPKFILYQRELDFRAMVALDMADKVVGLIVTVGIAWATGSYFALPIGILASQLARVILSYLFAPYRPRITLSHWRELVHFSVWMTLGMWVQTINWRTDPMVLGLFVPSAAIGQFSMAERTSGIISREILHPVSHMLFPAFSRIRSDAARLRQAYVDAQGVLVTGILPMAVGLALLSDPVVRLLLSDKWLPAVPYIQILAFCVACRLLQSLNPVAMATGDTKALFNRDLRGMLIRLPLMALGIIWGLRTGNDVILGALYGRAIAAAINALLNMMLIARISPVTVGDHVRLAARPVIAALVMSAVVWAASISFAPSIYLFQIAVEFGLLVALGAITYCATIAGLWYARGRPEGAETHMLDIAKSGLAKIQIKAG